MTKRPPPRTSFRTIPTPPDNPVQQAELIHLERTKRHGSGRVLLGLMLLALGASVGLGLALYFMGRSTGLGDAELMARFQTFRDYLAVANAILVILILAVGPVLVLETLLLTSDSLAREQRSGAWATLILTPLSAWQIVTGKWRAGQAYIYRHYGPIMVIRAVGFIWLSLMASFDMAAQSGPDPLALLAGAAMIVGFLAANLALAGAVSLLASSQGRLFATFGGAVSLQAVAVLGIATANILLLQPLFGPDAAHSAVMMVVTTVDSGVMAASQLSDPFNPNMQSMIVVFSLLNLALLVGLTLGVLRVVRRLAIREGAAA